MTGKDSKEESVKKSFGAILNAFANICAKDMQHLFKDSNIDMAKECITVEPLEQGHKITVSLLKFAEKMVSSEEVDPGTKDWLINQSSFVRDVVIDVIRDTYKHLGAQNIDTSFAGQDHHFITDNELLSSTRAAGNYKWNQVATINDLDAAEKKLKNYVPEAPAEAVRKFTDGVMCDSHYTFEHSYRETIIKNLGGGKEKTR